MKLSNALKFVCIGLGGLLAIFLVYVFLWHPAKERWYQKQDVKILERYIAVRPYFTLLQSKEISKSECYMLDSQNFSCTTISFDTSDNRCESLRESVESEISARAVKNGISGEFDEFQGRMISVGVTDCIVQFQISDK